MSMHKQMNANESDIFPQVKSAHMFMKNSKKEKTQDMRNQLHAHK